MGRRRRFTRKKGVFRNEGGGGRPKERKLNMGRLSSFEYSLKKILEGVEAGGAIFGNICSKSTNLGIAEAKQYVEVLADDGDIEKDKAGEIFELLNRFSTMR
jgi:hypothetical protein